MEVVGIVSSALQFFLFLYAQILPNDIQENNQITASLIQPKMPLIKKRTFKRFKNERYKPFYYNSTYEDNQFYNSPQFVAMPEEERKQYLLKQEEEKKNNQITEIYVTGWEIIEKSLNDNLTYPVLTFIIEFERKSEIYFTKRCFNEFLELFKSLQKHTRLAFPKLKQNKLDENQSPKDIQEIFSKILQVINSEQIGKHIYFQQFLMPKDKLEEFVSNQVFATFSSNPMLDTPQSYQRSSDYYQKFESLRRKCSASSQDIEAQVTHTMSFGQQNQQKQINIENLFTKIDNRPKYEHISVIDWDYGEPDENSMVIYGRSNVNTQAEDEVYFFIKYIKYKKNIPHYFVKRSIKDLVELRNYYELIYESRQFPSIIQSNLSINNVNKDSFRSENGYDSLKHQINLFFEYLIENQLTSLNLKKFLEENSAVLDDNENFSTQNLDNDSSHFMRNGNLN